MILVDTSVWIDYFNGISNIQCNKLDVYLQNEILIIGDLIYCEILQGFRSEKQFNEVKLYLNSFKHVELGGFRVALAAAKNYRRLRQAGITIRKTIDMIIGTWCINNNIRLLHNDSDFSILEAQLGLKTA